MNIDDRMKDQTKDTQRLKLDELTERESLCLLTGMAIGGSTNNRVMLVGTISELRIKFGLGTDEQLEDARNLNDQVFDLIEAKMAEAQATLRSRKPVQ